MYLVGEVAMCKRLFSANGVLKQGMGRAMFVEEAPLHLIRDPYHSVLNISNPSGISHLLHCIKRSHS